MSPSSLLLMASSKAVVAPRIIHRFAKWTAMKDTNHSVVKNDYVLSIASTILWYGQAIHCNAQVSEHFKSSSFVLV